MSDLNLIPNPQLMLAQAFIISMQVYVVNRFFIVPFSKLKKARESVTVGADSKSEELNSEIQKLTLEIKDSLNRVSDEVKNIKNIELTQAKKTRETSVNLAHKEMTELVNEARKNALNSYQEEIKKVTPLVSQYAEEFFNKISKAT